MVSLTDQKTTLSNKDQVSSAEFD